jgi:hypothetical protein
VVRCNSALCINDGRGWGSPSSDGGGAGIRRRSGGEDGRGRGDEGDVYQRIKTYEMGLFCFVSPKQVRGWYKPQSGYSALSVEDEA